MRFEETYRLSSCSVNSGRSRNIRVDYLQLFLVPVMIFFFCFPEAQTFAHHNSRGATLQFTQNKTFFRVKFSFAS